jgi:hypothetical protein
MVIFIKPGPIIGPESRAEYGFGHAGVLAQSHVHPLPEPINFHKNFRSKDSQSEHAFSGKSEAQQYKRSEEAKPSTEPLENIDDRICPKMTNKEFIEEFNEIRDKLIKILTNNVIPSVSQWGQVTRERAIKWFGTDSEKLKLILLNGYPKCVLVLKQMSGENFVKPTIENIFGCAPNSNTENVYAAVCPSDSGHHLVIYPGYCNSRTYSSTQSSKIGTILHEVCHFQTTFTSLDHAYDEVLSERLARTDSLRAINNTDSFVMFALHGVVYGNV